MILSSTMAGELTVGSLISGAPLLHEGFTAFVSLGAIGILFTTPLLKAPSPGNKMSDPVGTGDAAKCSVDFRTQSTSGLAGPATLSVFPVRRLLPRNVAQGASSATSGTVVRSRARSVRSIVHPCCRITVWGLASRRIEPSSDRQR